jgi:hypothetical protein
VEREHFGGPIVGYSFAPKDHHLLTGAADLNHNSAGQVWLLFEHAWF